MTEFLTAITKAGLAKEAKARRDNTKIKLVDFAVGDGELPSNIAELEQLTSLVNQQHRAAINGVMIDPDEPETIRINALIPHDVGGWFIRECGIYDSDGDLYAIAIVPPTFKNGPNSGAKKEIGLNVYIATANTQQIDLTIDPDSVIATREMLVVSMKQHKAESDPHTQYVQKSQLGKSVGDVSVVGDFGVGKLEYKGAANIDELSEFGFYRVFKATGTLPTGIGVGTNAAEFYVEVLPHETHGSVYIMQRILHVPTTRTFERRKYRKWQSWREVAFVDMLKKEMSDHEADPSPHPQYLLKTGGTVEGDLTCKGAINAKKGLYLNNQAVVTARDLTGNIDHFWHDDDNGTANNGYGGAWHFCSDAEELKSPGNSRIQAGSYTLAHAGKTVHLKASDKFSSYSGSALTIITEHGRSSMGMANSAHCHFATEAENFYFDKNVVVKGEIYTGPSYSQRVYHEGDQTDAINDGSSNKLATAKAAKTAYDKANAALPKSGGTMIGAINCAPEQHGGKHALNLNNSDVIGLNGLFCSDTSQSKSEGLVFPKEENLTPSTTMDWSKWMSLRCHNNSALFWDGTADRQLFHEGHKPTWNEVTNKPADYPPATHNHDDVYFKLDHRTKSVWVDVAGVGTTGDPYTALNWAKAIHPDDTFQDNDHLVILYANGGHRGTGNGVTYWSSRHMVTFLRSRSGWHLIASQPGREPA